MDFNITEEQMLEMLQSSIDARVYNLVDVYDVRRKADELIRTAVEGVLAEKFKATVRSIVDEFLTGPVDINDGWGSREHYDSYSDFFAAKIKQRMGEDRDIRREMRDALSKKVDKAWDQYKSEAIAEVLARHKDNE